jgi:aspartate/methionine/tyrosine aminotransferase
LKHLEETLKIERAQGKIIKAIVVINPHHPLGNILSIEEMQELIKFCEKNHLAIIACEEYQNSVYPDFVKGKLKKKAAVKDSQKLDITIKDTEGNVLGGKEMTKFHSFRYAVNKAKSHVELISIYSISKGVFFKYVVSEI